MLDESDVYLVSSPVAHLCLENLKRLRRLVSQGDWNLSEFHRYRAAILFQYDSLPRPLREEVLRRVEQLSDNWGLSPQSSPPPSSLS